VGGREFSWDMLKGAGGILGRGSKGGGDA